MSLYDAVKNAENPRLALKDAITELATKKRIPIGATFELSPICNFKCPFCYARRTPQELDANGETILRFAQWKRLIDEAAALGAVDMTLTGGECMLHPDFEKIYRYAYSKNMELILMTNASAVTPAILEMLRECPPEKVNVTVYGGSPETYARVCGSEAFYDRVLANIRAMLEIGVPVQMQFTAGKDNYSDLSAVAHLAKELACNLRYARADYAFRNATPEALSECEVSWKEFTETSNMLMDEQRRAALTEEQLQEREKAEIRLRQLPIIEKGMNCGGGTRSFYLDYKGNMHPCVSFDDISISTKDRPLSACWNELVEVCNEIPRLVECTNCIHQTHCKQCVALHYDDLGVFGKPSPRLCFKCQFPERAAEIEKRFARDGFLRADDLD